jgi:peptidoglycan/xylan/chitin deacetylase (PgdA/CDA1 family)
MKKLYWKNLAFSTAEKTGLINLLQRSDKAKGQALYVLAYHRVEEPGNKPWLDPEDISATPQQFEAQLKLISQRYNPVTIREVLSAIHGRQSLPEDAVLITVDDGYRNFKDILFPACMQFGIQPLLFLTTGSVGNPGSFWWDQVYQIIYHSGQQSIQTPAGHFSLVTDEEKHRARRDLLHALKRMPFHQMRNWVQTTHESLVSIPADKSSDTLTWDELRELKNAGAAIAPHTHTHPILTRIPLESAREEVSLSRDLIRKELGEVIPVFALPDGKAFAYDDAVLDVLKTEGFEIVFSMLEGRAHIQKDNPQILMPRLGVWRKLTLPHFHYRLTPSIDRKSK